MRPQMKTTILASMLGLSLALNAALAIGHLRSLDTNRSTPADHQASDDYCLLDSLELDAAQQQRLAEMRRRMHEKRTAFWQQANAIKADLADAICSVDRNHEGLDVHLERYAKNQAAMQRAVAEHLRDVNAMLRPEQRDGFRALLRTEMFRGIRSVGGEVVDEP